jgi:pimeloyl-ACP methyl ester carboxylesterase
LIFWAISAVVCFHHPQAANKMAYHDPKFATEDAMRVGRLHTHMPGWSDANIAFMRSGGYSISSRIKDVQQPTLVLWGRQDEILEPKYAYQFEKALPNGQLQWIEDCGHCGHLEQPTLTAAKILEFIGVGAAAAADASIGEAAGEQPVPAGTAAVGSMGTTAAAE